VLVVVLGLGLSRYSALPALYVALSCIMLHAGTSSRPLWYVLRAVNYAIVLAQVSLAAALRLAVSDARATCVCSDGIPVPHHSGQRCTAVVAAACGFAQDGRCRGRGRLHHDPHLAGVARTAFCVCL
jgi:hypothetical protein